MTETMNTITYAIGDEIPSTHHEYRSWAFLADGVVIGRIDENRYGYRGVLYGPDGPSGAPAFTGTSLPVPSSVCDQLTSAAKRRGITGDVSRGTSLTTKENR